MASDVPSDPPPSATSAYDYHLPPARIAQRPASPRDTARLLVVDRGAEGFVHATFRDLPRFLHPGDLLILNVSRVLRARLRGRRPTGGQAEVLLVEPAEPAPPETARRWRALVRPGRAAHPGGRILIGPDWSVDVEASGQEGMARVRLSGPEATAALLQQHGHVPLPPYIRRPDEPADGEDYQTVYATEDGSVAAPTAGLHFTPRLLDEVAAAGARTAEIVLHVGPGTFRPVKERDLRRHRLHAESFSIPPATSAAIEAARREGGRLVCVGTT
ncbi:MAG: tRNA preQ1(34) S-adenosylmethionine ribosyltransferase-isomerase QueA, partial [Candidatus Eisenbacteria bacterium]|nr:tRNA preQ1(34) S-adenosylmethionine ribosyltransferase-isomerase QueA [Candidatus Eisenbacteria bacterium]